MISRRACFRNLLQSLRTSYSSSKIGDYHRFASQASSSLQQVFQPSTYSDDEYSEVDWDNLGFCMMRTDYMYMTKCTKGECFEQGQLSRYGNIELSPAAGVLNYGQGLFEGTKAYRSEDGCLLLFRPEQNAIRMKMGAERMCMPSPSIDQFVDAVKQTAIANKRWGLKALTRAKSRGFSDVVYLDSVNKRFIEEVSSCNIFILKGNVISTPAANGTILEGVTRKSIIDIARGHGYQVEERVISLIELIDADEIFCTGTAVGVAPVGSVTYKGQRILYKTGPHTVSQELHSTLEGIKRGLIKDNKGWIVEID
ncbi:hypothetical protein I3843_15G038600 [Carya illinoinensis]|nr:hypothetical protein I3843_15G038600 [Carya illinoinensis]